MKFVSMFSGIDAASVAWNPLGWEALAFCEIEKFPSAVLAHHYPKVPNLGDVTKANFDGLRPDLFVFGSPCQSYSVAGKRLGLDDPRGNLALVAGRIVYGSRPRWFVFENVPGLLSSDNGWDFGTLLAAYAGYPSGSVFAPPENGWGSAGVIEQAPNGYGLAWRILDAQYFGVPQRRRRVFVVGCAGDWRRAAAVLFERHSLSGHSAPRREAGQRAAPTISARTEGGGGLGTDFDLDGGLIQAFGGNNTSGPIDIAAALNSKSTQRQDFETETLITGALACSGGHAYPGTTAHDAGEGFLLPVAYNITPSQSNKDYNARASERSQAITGNGNRPSARGGDVIAFGSKEYAQDAGDVAPPLRAMGSNKDHPNGGGQIAIAFNARQDPTHGPVADPLGTKDTGHGFLRGSAVRRLTPRECERLQGFPDDYTLIQHRGKPAADGPRYKALGNSMAVPVMSWIGERIAMVEAAQEAA